MRTILITILTLVVLGVPFAPVAAQTSPQAVLAYVGSDGNIYTANADGSNLVRLTGDGQKAADPSTEISVGYDSLRWSPDGLLLAAMRQQSTPRQGHLDIQNEIVVIDVANGTSRNTGLNDSRTTWAADSSALLHGKPASFGNQGVQPPFSGIYRYDLATGADTEVVAAQNYPLAWPNASTTGRYLAFYETIAMEGLGYFGMYDFQTQTMRTWEGDNFVEVGGVDWAADDSFIIFDNVTYTVHPDMGIFKADPMLNQIVEITPKVEGLLFFGAHLAPDGQRIAALSQSAANPQKTGIWVFTLSGSDPHEVYSTDQSIYGYDWSTDGRYITLATGQYQHEEIMLIEVETGATQKIADGMVFAWNPVLPAAVESQPATVEPTQPALTQAAEPVQPTLAPTREEIVPVDRILPHAPKWLTGTLLVALICGGGLLLAGLVTGAVLLWAKGKKKES